MRRRNRFQYRTIVIASAITAQIVGPLLIGIFIGRWIDVRFVTDPLFMIIGLLSGLALGVYGMTRLLEDKIQGD